MTKVGVLGGGQLGQMLALAGHPIGIEVSCYDTSPTCSASHGGVVVAGKFNELDKIRAWAATCDVITYEWENVPIELVSDLAVNNLVRPAPNALAAAQDRWHEKRLLADLQIPVAPFRLCSKEGDLISAMMEIGPDVIAKTRRGGYDGKGQVRLHEDITPALALLEQGDVVVEQLVDFEFEASIIAARSSNGHVVLYPTTLNEHRNGILHHSIAHAGLTQEQQHQAGEFVSAIMNKLEYVGVIALELFSTRDGRLVANEIAPRVHNSGHWTIEGSETSQFENHLRAICGLPLGGTDTLCDAAMVNIIGNAPNAIEILKVPGASLHTYQKAPRPGRKLGHVTVVAQDENVMLSRLAEVEKYLS